MFSYILSIVAAMSVAAMAAKLPKGTVVCKKDHPNIHECVRDAIQQSLPKFIGGVPELNINSIDPFRIPRVVIDQKKDDASPVNVDLSWQDVTITGIKSAVITSAKAMWDDNMVSFEAKLTEPVDITGKYTVDGIVLILPIKGSGTFDCKLEGFKAHIKVHGKDTIKDGKKYMEVDRLAFTFDVDHLTLQYNNLFNGDPVLGESMNAFLNENWRDILDEMKNSVEANFSAYFKEVAKKVFNEIPIDEIAGFKAHIKIHGKDTIKDGKKYMEVDRPAFTFDVDHLTLQYNNLFNGDPVLGESMNAFLNENCRVILNEMKNSFEANFFAYFKEVAKKVFNEIPIDEIAVP